VPTDGNGRVKHLVKNGVAADQVQIVQRPSSILRQMAREMVERGIVALHESAKREHLTGDDADLLAKYVRLLDSLDGKDTGPDKELTEADLAKAVR
jgi:hypothetical protein